MHPEERKIIFTVPNSRQDGHGHLVFSSTVGVSSITYQIFVVNVKPGIETSSLMYRQSLFRKQWYIYGGRGPRQGGWVTLINLPY